MSVVMSNHFYIFDGKMHYQQSGGSIGLELTGHIAQFFMIWWDRAFKSRLKTLDFSQAKQAVRCNINVAADEAPLGTPYETVS